VLNGRRPDGTMLPAGMYTAYVSASDGTFSSAMAVRVQMNAFAVSMSTLTPTRGGRLTVTATTAEPLTGHVELYVTQPGLATSVLPMPAISSKTYRLALTLKGAGSAGTLVLKVWAKDADGRSQATSIRLVIS